jgi:SAM-dependent methyltransferase
MGIGRAEVALLLEEAQKRPFVGSLGTLGRQSIHASAEELALLFKRRGLPCATFARQDILDTDLFSLLGFKAVESVDYSSFEGATHIADLNHEIPSDLRERFDVVLDGGTLEHVFNFPAAIKNTIRMAKVGGRIIYILPVSNHVDHGFYMFSPTLFMDYFAANNIGVETFYVVRYSTNPKKPWHAYAYDAESHNKLSIGCLDSHPYMLFIVARRLENSTTDEIPHQSHYQKTWTGQELARPSPLYYRVQRSIGWMPGAMKLAIFLRNLAKPRDVRALRYVGKY